VIESLDTIVSNNIAYFTSEDGKLYAVNATTGAVLWKKSLVSQDGSDLSSPAISANGGLYLCTTTGGMHALNAKTGAVLWTNSSVNCSGGSSPTIVQNTIFIGGKNNVLYALNASTGKVLWSRSLSTTPASINGSPAVVNGIVYVAFSDAGFQTDSLYALNSTTGATEWTYEINSPGGQGTTVVADGVVFVESEGVLYAFNASSGTLKWTSKIGVEDASPAVFDKMVYIGGNGLTLPDTKIFALSESTGSPIWKVNTKANVFSSATVANGVAYDVSLDGTIYALNALTGATLWTGKAGNCPTGKTCTLSSPVVVNGILYEGGSDGKMYAFHLEAWCR
jgi:outer membrane protein assembly factor BamB